MGSGVFLCSCVSPFTVSACLYFSSRGLEARAQNELFRAFFRLPRQERLHAVVDCSLWTPFSRCHTAGRLFASDSYICFASKEDGCCSVILPLREVGRALPPGGPRPGAHSRASPAKDGIWREAWPGFDQYPFGCCSSSVVWRPEMCVRVGGDHRARPPCWGDAAI